MSVPAGYRWRIRVYYRRGRSQAWDCDDEAAARAEFARILAEKGAGEHPSLDRIEVQRAPSDPWETVESRSFGD